MTAPDRTELLRTRVERADDLPTLPTVVARIGQMLRDPKVSASAIGDVLAEDPVLTARILRLVNSAYYGFPQKITHVSRAIVILGFQKIHNVVLTASVFSRFAQPAGFPLCALWEHSIAVAIASESLAESLQIRERAEEAFVSGLLHDLGKVVVAHVAPADFAKVVELQRSRDLLFREAERQVLGTDHAEVGFWLARRWGLPEGVQNAIRFHHEPQTARAGRVLASLVHVADLLARALNIGSGGDPHIPVVSQAAWDDLAITPERADRAVRRTVERLAKAEAFFSLVRGEAA
ncbi:MAG: HDOD domain-containing protein [Planctomycetes bacterium]|nr:HDOD domain-containing protein [Planctomycetota bacterium]